MKRILAITLLLAACKSGAKHTEAAVTENKGGGDQEDTGIVEVFSFPGKWVMQIEYPDQEESLPPDTLNFKEDQVLEALRNGKWGIMGRYIYTLDPMHLSIMEPKEGPADEYDLQYVDNNNLNLIDPTPGKADVIGYLMRLRE